MNLKVVVGAVLAGAQACLAFSSFVSPASRFAVRCTPTCTGSLQPLRLLSRASLHGLQKAKALRLRRPREGLRSFKAMFTGIVEEMGSVAALKEEEMKAWDSPGKMVKGVTLTLSGMF